MQHFIGMCLTVACVTCSLVLNSELFSEVQPTASFLELQPGESFFDIDPSVHIEKGFRSGIRGHRGRKGRKGPKGPKGHRGHLGHRGHHGKIGLRGPRGRRGPALFGPIGPIGAIGPTGPTGPIGATGAQLLNVHIMATDTDTTFASPIPFTSVGAISGFSPPVGGTNFVIPATGYYLITVDVSSFVLDSPPAAASITLQVNGINEKARRVEVAPASVSSVDIFNPAQPFTLSCLKFLTAGDVVTVAMEGTSFPFIRQLFDTTLANRRISIVQIN